MATQLRKELSYDASVEEVAAMLLDPAFRERVLAAQRVVRGSVSVEGSDVTIEQVWSAASIPSFARKFVGDEIVIVQTETWTSAHGADVELAIPGKPGEAVGTLALVESDGTTTETVELAVNVRIPLVGGKIEAMIADMVGHALDVEHEVGVEWLSR